jgi:hypothetical protein
VGGGRREGGRERGREGGRGKLSGGQRPFLEALNLSLEGLDWKDGRQEGRGAGREGGRGGESGRSVRMMNNGIHTFSQSLLFTKFILYTYIYVHTYLYSLPHSPSSLHRRGC